MSKEKGELYTKTRIKREFGWSDKCIRYLPESDGNVRSWYGIHSGWTKDTILEIEQKPEVQEILENNRKHRKVRQNGAEKALETKRKKTVQDIEKLNVVIRKGYSHQQLVKMILAEHQNDDNFTVGNREIVNFIRHVGL